jgi:PPOX class probable F420-dependent enzyme
LLTTQSPEVLLMTQMTREEIAEFLSLPLIAHLITMRADGSPNAVPMWYICTSGRFYLFTPTLSLKIQNIKRDPRMTIPIASAGQPYRYVVANGVAEIGAREIEPYMISIASRYEGVEGGVKYVGELQARLNLSLISMKPISVVE